MKNKIVAAQSSSLPEVVQTYELASNPEFGYYHMQAPNQLTLFNDSDYAIARGSSYKALYTTCGWVAAFAAVRLCNCLSENLYSSKDTLARVLLGADAPKFIRDAVAYVDDMAPYGGGNDPVEGQLCGQDIVNIFNSCAKEFVQDFFVCEGVADSMGPQNEIQFFDQSGMSIQQWGEQGSFSSLRDAIDEIRLGKRPFIVLVSFETLPKGEHFITFVIRKNPEGQIEAVIFEGLNEVHNDWLLLGSDTPAQSDSIPAGRWLFDQFLSK